MRLHLILPRVEPEEIKAPSESPYEDCDGTHFQLWQEVEKPLRDTKHSRVVAHRYQCLRCFRTHRVYPRGSARIIYRSG
jgi:transposase